MANLTVKGNPLGSGTFTVEPPNSNTSRTLTLPDVTGTLGLNPLPAAAVGSVVDGEFEYDGKVGYFTPVQRGVMPAQQYFRLNADRAGSNATGAQSIFGVGVTLSASTIYAFDLVFVLAKTAGATSHTVSLLFGGTATVNNILVQGMANGAASALSNAAFGIGASYLHDATTGAVAFTSAIASANSFAIGQLSGTVSVNTGGTFIPQYSLSAAPGGAYSTKTGSYMRIYPIGAAGADVNVGTWA